MQQLIPQAFVQAHPMGCACFFLCRFATYFLHMKDIDSLEALKSFLGKREDGEDVSPWDFWFLKGKVLRPGLLGPEGFIPSGLFEYQPKSFEDLESYLCESKEGLEAATIFQVINLDVRADSSESLVMSALRWQGIPEHDAMLAFSSSPQRIEETRAAFGPTSKLMISESQALFIIDTSAIKP